MSQNPGPSYGQTPPPGQPYGYPPQQPAPQPYGQPPQQAQSYAYPPQQQAQPYDYPSQQPPTQQYMQPVQGYAQTPMGASGAALAPTKRSPFLGMLALVLVVISGIVLTLYLYRIGLVAGPYAVNGTLDTSTQPDLVQDVASQLGGVLPTLGGASIFVGFVGWILGIVATATKRGRAFGVLTIILGILAPIIAFVALFVALAPYLS